MMEPVLLPSSNVIVDRSVIAKHLLSDPIDPFNRQPLEMTDVVPQTDLKDEIHSWKENQLAEIQIERESGTIGNRA
jgi:ubiquitin conjugation factor E4 B